MTLEIEIDGRVHTVTVQPVGEVGSAGGRFRITLGGIGPGATAEAGEAIDLDARLTDVGLSLVYPDGRSVDAAIGETVAGECLVQLPRVNLVALVDGRRYRRAGSGGAGVSGAQRVTAPMPGRIIRVLVKPGDQVTARQGLVVIEAMKMENELTAARAGRVSEVAVAAGSSVESGRLLVVIE